MCQHSRDEIGKQGITAVPSKPLDVIPHVASALCTAYEQHATSRTVAAAIKSLFDECVGISLQLPLSKELLVCKTNFASLDLVSAVLVQRATLSSWAVDVGPTSSVLHRARECTWLDAQLAAGSIEACHKTLYLTCVPLVWHAQWQALCSMLNTTVSALDTVCHQAARDPVFPCIGTLTVVCSQPPSEPLEQLSRAMQLALTLAPKLLHAAQPSLLDSALAAGIMPEYPYSLEYCPGEGFVTLSLDDFPAYEEDDEAVWAAGAEEEPAAPKRKHTRGGSCSTSTATRRNDDDDAAGAQPATSKEASQNIAAQSTPAKPKRMARISSVLHTIPESLPGSTTSTWHGVCKQPPNHDSASSKSNTTLVMVNPADLRQGRLLTFCNQFVEWHYHVQQSVQGLPYDVMLLSLLALFATSTLGNSNPAFIVSTVLMGAVWGLAAWPAVMSHVREELFLLLALRQLVHIDWMQGAGQLSVMEFAVSAALTALSCVALLRVRLHKQACTLVLCTLAYALMYCLAGGPSLLQRAPLLGKLLGCCMLTFWFEQGRRSLFARAVINRAVPVTPSQLSSVKSSRSSAS